jgi:hypothetical protein
MRIAGVYVFTNGVTMVFGEDGEQMPQFQGTLLEKKSAILNVSDESTEFHFAKWNGPSMRLSHDEFLRLTVDPMR